MKRRTGFVLCVLVTVTLGCSAFRFSSDGFRCTTHESCALAGQPGTCEASGYCSVTDSSCVELGRRYGRYAGKLSNGCVTCEPGADPCCRSATCIAPTSGACAIDIATGGAFACAVRSDGTVSCWGDNQSNQLGSVQQVAATGPVVVQLTNGTVVSRISEVRAGQKHACARDTNGVVYCWGANRAGQLGNGTTEPQLGAALVAGLGMASQITVGGEHVCASTLDSRTMCWGANEAGQLGNPNIAGTGYEGCFGEAPTPNSSTPVPLYSLCVGKSIANSFTLVTAGGAHTCAAGNKPNSMTYNPLLCWGANSSGQLGNGQFGPDPYWVADSMGNLEFPGVTRLGLGTVHTCAVRLDGTVWCWGGNASGQLGTGGTAMELAAVPVSTSSEGGSFDSVSDIAAGGAHTCALMRDHTVWCWGDNTSGQLGDHTMQRRTRPVRTLDAAGAPLGDVEQVVAGNDFTCARTKTGAVLCWGDNTRGQLGALTASGSSWPRIVPIRCSQ